MITPDDNGSSGYARLKRWREKHRGLTNLRQREYRSGKKGVDLVKEEVKSEATLSRTEIPILENPPSFTTKKVGEFRMIMIEPEKPLETSEVARPLVFRNDYGSIITERQWNALQEKKEKAKKGGYVLDEWSQ